MELSLSLAKAFGLGFVLVGLGMLGNAKHYKAMLDDFMKSPALMYFAGVVVLVAGFFLVLKHNVWEGGWPVLITLFAWLTLLKGAAYLLFPGQMMELGKAMNKKDYFMWYGLLLLALGAFLLYVGFAG